MIRNHLRMVALAVCVVGVTSFAEVAPRNQASDSTPFEGLWSGSWGGGEQPDGVIFQPVIGELMIKGDTVELCRFRNAGRIAGTVRFDATTKQMHITPTAAAVGQPAPQAIVYAYKIKGDELTLVDRDKFSISLHRHRVANNPLANAGVGLVAATGINEAGDLLVTEFRVLKAGRTGATYFHPEERSLKTKQATVFLVQESGLKKITTDEARRLIRKPTPVAVVYRGDERPMPHQLHELWTDMGAPVPDNDAVLQTFAQILRPWTLVFILSERENAPVP